MESDMRVQALLMRGAQPPVQNPVGVSRRPAVPQVRWGYRWRRQKGVHPWRCYCHMSPVSSTSLAEANRRAACCGGRSYRVA